MSITTTNLLPLVQADIDALTTASPAKQLLKVAVESKGLNVNKANLVTAINGAIAAAVSGTSENDLIALNAARLAVQESAVRTSVGDTRAMHIANDLYVNEGEHWLKAGIVDDDLTTYPSAKRTLIEVVESIKTGLNAFFYFTWDGAHFWELDYNTRLVTQYDENWNSTGVTFSAASQVSLYAHGIFWDGSYLVITHNGDNNAYKYERDGTYVTSYSIGTPARSLSDGCLYSGHVYLVGYYGEIEKRTKSGTLVASYNVGSIVDAVEGIEVIGDKFYIVSRNSGFVYEFDDGFNHTGIVISLGQQAWNLCAKDEFLYSSSGSTIVRAIRADVVGIPERLEENGVPIFVRVK